MPLLVGDALAGWVDPAREGRTLVLRAAELWAPGAAAELASALQEAAEWTGCDSVNPEIPGNSKLTTQLRRALS
jgi:hypothetical protein